MNFLQGIQNFLEIINENWTTIIVIIGLAILEMNTEFNQKITPTNSLAHSPIIFFP